MLEALVGHQVPGPGVSYLVGYHISIGLHKAYKIYITIITLMLGMVWKRRKGLTLVQNLPLRSPHPILLENTMDRKTDDAQEHGNMIWKAENFI